METKNEKANLNLLYNEYVNWLTWGLGKHLSCVLKTFRRTKRWILSREINKNSFNIPSTIIPLFQQGTKTNTIPLWKYHTVLSQISIFSCHALFFCCFFLWSWILILLFGQNVVCLLRIIFQMLYYLHVPSLPAIPKNIYILLDVLLCSIAEYFYELCRILTSP